MNLFLLIYHHLLKFKLLFQSGKLTFYDLLDFDHSRVEWLSDFLVHEI